MKADPLLSSWIVEALGASGRTASPLAVAKLVWARHETELRSTGDLLFTWQLDLRATADALASEDRLTVEDSGDWTLPAGTAVPDLARRTWTDDEIATVAEAYAAMLRAEQTGRPMSSRQVVADLAAATNHSGDQVEALMSNVSAVVQEHGLAPLASFRPRSNVPVGVRPAVAAALDV